MSASPRQSSFSILDLPPELLKAIASHGSKLTCMRLSQTCQVLHAAASPLLFRTITIRLGDVEWLPKAIEAISQSSWEHVKTVVLNCHQGPLTLLDAPNLAYFLKHWSFLLKALPKGITLNIDISSSGNTESIEWWKSAYNALLMTVEMFWKIQPRESNFTLSLPRKSLFSMSQIIHISQYCPRVCLQLAYWPPDVTGQEAQDLASAFPVNSDKSIELRASIVRAHRILIPLQANITNIFLHVNGHSHIQATLQSLPSISSSLVELTIFQSRGQLPIIDALPLVMQRLRKLTIYKGSLDTVEHLVTLFKGPALLKVYCGDCLGGDVDAQNVSRHLRNLQEILADVKCQVAYATAHTLKHIKKWRELSRVLSMQSRIFAEMDWSLRFAIHLDGVYNHADLDEQLRVKSEPIDNCCLDQLIAPDIRPNIEILTVKLDDWYFQPKLCQERASFPHLREMHVTLSTESVDMPTKFNHLFNGPTMANLEKLHIGFLDHPPASTIERNLQHVALFITPCISLKLLDVTWNGPDSLFGEDPLDFLRTTARRKGVEMHVYD